MPKILAIDNIDNNLISLKAIINNAFPGSIVLTAPSGPKGIELAMTDNPDIILLDIIMPGMDGFEVCTKLKANKKLRDIPVVFMTQFNGNKEDRIKALECGGEAFLAIPIDEYELIAQIRAMVKIKNASRQNCNEKLWMELMVDDRTRQWNAELQERKTAEELPIESDEFNKALLHDIHFEVSKTITGCNAIDMALNEREQIFQILFNSLPDAILLIDPHHPTISWPIVDCNQASCLMNGYTREELIGQSIDIFNTSVGDQEERLLYFTKLKMEGIQRSETIHLHKNGYLFPVEVSSSIVTIGEQEFVLGIDRDITDRKQAEAELREGEVQYRNLANSGIALIWTAGTDKLCNYFNEPWLRFTGRPLEKELGNGWAEGVHQDDLKMCIQTYISSFDKRLPFEIEYRLRHVSGEYRWLQDMGTPNYNHDGEFVGYIGYCFDITDRKVLEMELVAAREIAEKSGQELKIRNEELLAKNRFIQTIQDNLPIGLALNKIDNGEATYLNKKFQDIYGWNADEITSITTFFEHVFPNSEYRNQLNKRIFADIQTGEPEKMHWENIVITRKDGAQRIINAVNIPLYEQNTMVSTVTDVTDRWQAEADLRASEDRYRSFISQVSEGVYRFECDQSMELSLPLEDQVDFIYDHFFIAECNQALLEMYELTHQNEMIGKRHFDFYGGRDNQVNRELIRDFIRNGYRTENGLSEEFSSTGQQKYIRNNSVGIIENNHLVRILGTGTDITEKIRADQVQEVLYTISKSALSSKDLPELCEIIRNELNRLLDSTNFYIAFYDEPSGMLSTNYHFDVMDHINHWRAEKSATGYVINHNKSLLARDVDMIKLCEQGEIVMIGTPAKIWLGVPLTIEQKVIGAIVVQSYDNQNAYTEKDKLVLEFISSQIGISIERKIADQEIKASLAKAQESDRLKSAFLANMSHEIRTPLNSIIGFSDLLLDSEFEATQLHEFAKIISNSGSSLLTIISDIMDISKIEAGQIHLDKKRFSVQRLINNTQIEHIFKAVEKGIELQLNPSNPKKEVYIESDENRIKQVLNNLVGNAFKFTENGSICIGFDVVGNCVQFNVSDSGIGIPKEYHSTIFERFWQVESTYSRTHGGNGLGLAISKSLIELLGGQIWIESEQGKGSTFYFTIPIGK